jgi:hypothetical protein
MRMTLRTALFAALAAGSIAAFPFATSEPAEAVGCLSGALAGGVAGHYAGHHAVAGAIGGCIVGHHLHTLQVQKEKAAEAAKTATPAPVSAPAATPAPSATTN